MLFGNKNNSNLLPSMYNDIYKRFATDSILYFNLIEIIWYQLQLYFEIIFIIDMLQTEYTTKYYW